MNKEQYFYEKQRLQSSQFYSFQEDAIIKFQNFLTVTNQSSQNIKRQQNKINDDIFLGIRLNPNFQLGIYQKIEDRFILIKVICLQKSGTKFLESVLQKYLKQQNLKRNLAECAFCAFQKQAINKVDLFVSDIYGSDSSTIGIPGYILASSLGTAAKNGLLKYQDFQIIRSILISNSLSIAQIAGLSAIKYNIKTIIMLQNPLKSIIFTKFIYSILKFYNPNAKILFKD